MKYFQANIRNSNRLFPPLRSSLETFLREPIREQDISGKIESKIGIALYWNKNLRRTNNTIKNI
jgi:O-succinylbenzoate synthase